MAKVLLQSGHENIRNNCVASLRGSTGAGVVVLMGVLGLLLAHAIPGFNL